MLEKKEKNDNNNKNNNKIKEINIIDYNNIKDEGEGDNIQECKLDDIEYTSNNDNRNHYQYEKN